MQNLNQKNINCVSGGKHCRAVITVNDPNGKFMGIDIKRAGKPIGNGKCDGVLPGSSSFGIEMRNYKSGESVVCECSDEYTKDTLIIQNPKGDIFKKL